MITTLIPLTPQAALSDEEIKLVRNRAHKLGLKGSRSGWVTLPTGLACQGWFMVAWTLRNYLSVRVAAGTLDAGLREILEGKRVGIPTLEMSKIDQLAVALLSTCEVSPRFPGLLD